MGNWRTAREGKDCSHLRIGDPRPAVDFEGVRKTILASPELLVLRFEGLPDDVQERKGFDEAQSSRGHNRSTVAFFIRDRDITTAPESSFNRLGRNTLEVVRESEKDKKCKKDKPGQGLTWISARFLDWVDVSKVYLSEANCRGDTPTIEVQYLNVKCFVGTTNE